MSTGSPDAPSSPRESEGSEKIPSGSDGGTEGENIPQEVQLTYKDEFANEVWCLPHWTISMRESK